MHRFETLTARNAINAERSRRANQFGLCPRCHRDADACERIPCEKLGENYWGSPLVHGAARQYRSRWATALILCSVVFAAYLSYRILTPVVVPLTDGAVSSQTTPAPSVPMKPVKRKRAKP